MFENAELWSNYSHVDTSECHMEPSGGEQMIDHTEASPYELFSNGEKYKGGCR